MRRPFVVLLGSLVVLPPVAAQRFFQPSGFVVEDSVLRRLWATGMDSSELSRLA